MDEETANKLYDIVLVRAGLKGKPGEKWTDGDERRFGSEMSRMPGVFRDYANYDLAMSSERNKELAESYGMDTETFLRLSDTGNDTFMRRMHRPESSLRDPNPGMPDNTYGIAITDAEITPS